jgi:hypothetical protein
MNKRIKELADQARLLAGWPVGEVEYQKFAELIIADCLACCAMVAQAAIDARDGASDAYSHGREDAASLCKSTIRKHFGEGK